MRRLNRTTVAIAAALTLCAAALWMAPVGAQEIDPEVEAQWDTPEMTRLVQEAERMPLMEHATLVDRLRSALDKRLLTPAPDAAERFDELKARDDAGVARLLTRGLFEKQTRVRGGGAYFSFATKSNDYDSQPDLELHEGRFSSGFYGANFGVFALLDVRDLRAVTEDNVPESLRGDAYATYDGKQDRLRSADAEDGQVYALRSILWGEHDALTVFQVIGTDEYGVTIAWRRLRTYETLDHPGRRNR